MRVLHYIYVLDIWLIYVCLCGTLDICVRYMVDMCLCVCYIDICVRYIVDICVCLCVTLDMCVRYMKDILLERYIIRYMVDMCLCVCYIRYMC